MVNGIPFINVSVYGSKTVLFEKIFSELITDADFQEICIDSSMCKVHQSANGVKKR